MAIIVPANQNLSGNRLHIFSLIENV